MAEFYSARSWQIPPLPWTSLSPPHTGFIGYSAPQVAGTAEPFRSALRGHLKGHSEALEDLAVEMLARGLSVRDIEGAFKDETGRLLLSRTADSELGERLWADYQDFATRDLGEYDIVYLFIDGIAERIRPGSKREPVLAAWGFTAEGRKVLLHLMAGSKEDAETVWRVLPGHARPRLGRSAARRVRRRRRHHQGDRELLPALRAPALPGAPHAQPGGQAARGRLTPVQGPRHRLLSGALAAGVVADYQADYPSAVDCFMDDFEACIAHLRLPIAHRRATRTTILLERLFVEERRRLKITPNAFGEKPVLKLMFGAMIRAAERWRAIKVTDFERRQMKALRAELDHEYDAQTGLAKQSSKDNATSELSSTSRT